MPTDRKDADNALLLIEQSIGTLAYYYRTSQEAEAMEEILNHILTTGLISRAPDRYARSLEEATGAQIGKVWIGRANNPDHYCMDILFWPSARFQDKVRYVQSPIGVINLARKTYAFRSRDMAEPEELFRDTEAIVSQWGLRKTAHHRSPQD